MFSLKSMNIRDLSIDQNNRYHFGHNRAAQIHTSNRLGLPCLSGLDDRVLQGSLYKAALQQGDFFPVVLLAGPEPLFKVHA